MKKSTNVLNAPLNELPNFILRYIDLCVIFCANRSAAHYLKIRCHFLYDNVTFSRTVAAPFKELVAVLIT